MIMIRRAHHYLRDVAERFGPHATIFTGKHLLAIAGLCVAVIGRTRRYIHDVAERLGLAVASFSRRHFLTTVGLCVAVMRGARRYLRKLRRFRKAPATRGEIGQAQVQGIAACASPPAPTPFARLRGVAYAGNLLVCGFVLGAGTWSAFAPLESAAIASGGVETESSRKTIQHLEGGIVRDILVADGDVVRAGQTLIRLEDTRARAEAQSLKGQLWEAKAREARLLAEHRGDERLSFSDELEAQRNEDASVAAVLAGQQSIFETRRQAFRSQAALIREKKLQVEKEIVGLRAQEAAAVKRAEIVREEVATVVTLVKKGLERRPRLMALEREMAEIDGRVGETAAQISRAEQVISESQIALLKLESDRQNEIAQAMRDVQSQIFQLGERLRAANDQLSRTEVKAPEDGVVTDLRIHTPGGVVGAGAPLLDLVPRQDRLIVIARVRPEDIDVVRLGLSAEVHLLPYNQRRVPRLKGVVTHVSADRLVDKRTDQPYYAAKVRVQDERTAELNGIEIVPGMPTQVFIKTGQSTVALYALRPLLDSFHSAFRED